MFCPQCGTQVGTGKSFCYNCGADLRFVGASPPQIGTAAARAVAGAAAVADVGSPEVVYGGTGARIGAAILDVLLISLIGGALGVLFGVGAVVSGTRVEPDTFQAISRWAVLALYWLYFAGCESVTGTTPGKSSVGLRVTDRYGDRPSFGRATARWIVKLVGTFFFFIGPLVMVFNKRKRALHDLVAGTLVVEALPEAAPGGGSVESEFPLRRVWIWLLNLLLTPISGALMYYIWRRRHRAAATYANRVSLLSFGLYVAFLVVLGVAGPMLGGSTLFNLAPREQSIQLTSGQYYKTTIRADSGTSYRFEVTPERLPVLIGCSPSASFPASVALTGTGIVGLPNSRLVAAGQTAEITDVVVPGSSYDCAAANPSSAFNLTVRLKFFLQ